MRIARIASLAIPFVDMSLIQVGLVATTGKIDVELT